MRTRPLGMGWTTKAIARHDHWTLDLGGIKSQASHAAGTRFWRECEGSRADAVATCIGGSAVLRAELRASTVPLPSEHRSHATVATIAALVS
jgi:hypothetical protein